MFHNVRKAVNNLTTSSGITPSSSTHQNQHRRRRSSQFRAWNSYIAKKETAAALEVADKRRGETAILRKLTVRLIDTYEGINETYYRKLEERKGNGEGNDVVNLNGTGRREDRKEKGRSGGSKKRKGHVGHGGKRHKGKSKSISDLMAKKYCDKDYNYIVKKGELFNMRYVLEKVVGKGSFGQVVRSFDTKLKKYVAIKIIKNNKPYFEQALAEIRMTSFLNRIDPDDGYSIVRLYDKFIYRGHQCLVLELLSFSLYDLLRSTEFYGVSLNLVRKFCKQITNCLAFLGNTDN